MSDNYLMFAVSRIRAEENTLLGANEIDSLVNAKNVEAAMKLLVSYGWNEPSEYDFSSLISNEEKKAWELIDELLPDSPEKKFLTVINDFHNIKTALKGFVISKDWEPIYPTRIEKDLIEEALKKSNFDLLDKDFREAVKEGYRALAGSSDGQISDTVIDKYALSSLLKFAKESESKFLMSYANAVADKSDILIAFRGGRASKNLQYFSDALVSTDNLDCDALSSAAVKGEDAFFSYIEDTAVGEIAGVLKQSTSDFEKKYDNLLCEILASTRTTAFGSDPITAYWMAKENELKNVRIILVCKHNGVEPEKIAERMRDMYV